MAAAVALLPTVPTERILGSSVALSAVPSLFTAGAERRSGVKQWVDMRL